MGNSEVEEGTAPGDLELGDAAAPSEVRALIMAEHKHIRTLLQAVELAAKEVQNLPDSESFQNLRVRAATLLSRLKNHINLENRVLAPALRDTDSYGPHRARKLIEDHTSQKAQLEANLQALNDRSHTATDIAEAMLSLVDFVREDMEEEERTLLNPDLLRDDIIVTDMYTG